MRDKQEQCEKQEKDQGFIRHTPLVLFLIHSLYVLSASAQAARSALGRGQYAKAMLGN